MTDLNPPGAGAYEPPAVPVSASALITDSSRRLLILRPTYKSGWTLPGGVMEAGGETPWQACQREAREETGLTVTAARLACVDFRRPKPGNPGGVRFLFQCEPLPGAAFTGVVLQEAEISAHLLLPVARALELLRKPIRRRVKAVLHPDGRPRHPGTVYLEQGRPVPAVTAG